MFYVTAYYKDVPGFKSSERVKYATLPGAEARVMQIMGDKRELAGKYSVALTSERVDAVVPVVTLWEGGR